MSFIGPALPPHLLANKESDEEPPVAETPEVTSIDLPKATVVREIEEEEEEEEEVLHLHPEDEVEEEEEEAADLYGPALPPGFSVPDSSQTRIIGPTLPPGLRDVLEQQVEDQESEEEEDIVVGPLPIGAEVNSEEYLKSLVESRAERMRKKMEDKNKDKGVQRETWMLEAPKNRSGAMGLEARSFRRSAGPDKSEDNSIWTDTPEEKLRKAKAGVVPKVTPEMIESKAMQERDKAMAERARKHSKKRPAESLVELHQKELNKKSKEGGNKPAERRMFDRDKDLQVNRFDDAQKRAVLNKAKFLDDRFSGGAQKFL